MGSPTKRLIFEHLCYSESCVPLHKMIPRQNNYRPDDRKLRDYAQYKYCAFSGDTVS